MNNEYKISQLTSASGWYANFENQGLIYQYPVICWASIDDDDLGFPMVVGMLPLDGSKTLWTPDEVEEYFSPCMDSSEERAFRFVEYSQVARKTADLNPRQVYVVND